MIYTVGLVVAGALASLSLGAEFRRYAGHRDRADGIAGAVAWVTGEALLMVGIGCLAAAGVAHADGVDVGAVWVAPVSVLAAVALVATVRPAKAARHLRQGAWLTPALVTVLTVAAYFGDQDGFNRTNFGPLVQTVVFFSAPALLTAALLRLATPPERRTPSLG